MEPYYYAKMNKQEKNVYQAMKIGMMKAEKMILVPRMEVKQLYNIFLKMRLDTPFLFWVSTFRCRSYQDSSHIQIVPTYIFEGKKLAEQQRAMTSRVEKLTKQNTGKTSWEKEKWIHDFLCENVCYDKLKKPYSHEIIGPLGHGVGVCEGIAKAAKILLDAAGVPCIIALSDANPEKGIKYRHVWNVVRIEGTWYHLDVTFDLSLSREEIRYDYFNLDDSRLFRDHEPVMTNVPACADGNHFYYLEQKLSFTKMDMLEKRVIQAAKKNRRLTFHWRGGYLTRQVLDEMLRMIQKCGREWGKFVHIGLNWQQAVLSVDFSKEKKDSLEVEDANEGEKEGMPEMNRDRNA